MALTTPTSLEEVLMHVNREIPLVEVAKSSASYPPSDLDAALFRAQQ